jgi:type III pantothenate kinase
MPDAVVDIGNSRIKFCRVEGGSLKLPVRGLPTFDLATWERLATEWTFAPGRVWAVASTDPARRKQFANWATSRGEKVIAIDSPRQVSIAVRVDEPASVGIDRLLNVLAASVLVKPGQPAIVVDAGSAVTVDLLDEQGGFAGGTISPGLRLMALSLRENTAQLPLVDASESLPAGPPGKNTDAAMKLGIVYAVAGGIDAVIRETAARCTTAPYLFLTGGDMTPQLAGLLQSRHQFQSEIRPTLTLEGILRAAESRP